MKKFLRLVAVLGVMATAAEVMADVSINNKYLTRMDERIKAEKRTINKNDFIKRQLMHMRHVQNNMFLLEKNLDKLSFRIKNFELMKRAMFHDLDKLTNKIEENYDVFRYKFYERNGLTFPDDISVDAIHKTSNEHHNTYSHHFEYHIINNIPLSDVDICEIASDIYAVKIEKEEQIEDTLKFVDSLAAKFSLKGGEKKKLVTIIKLLDSLYN
ncbi:MAG: DUF5662 family protein [Rickettsiales bacterium]|jgi:hypothetical protein|nr:DUF5662 family protein [Rickettsiales bacterium]